MKQNLFEGTMVVCAHQVSFFYRLPDNLELTREQQTHLEEEAEERAKSQITEGYVQGELNYESEDLSCRGWWKIENN